ncbi:uncharacterized protein LOC125036813 [Penaeus chinensis]|uniref:uncharacterized protein LOC125036813 n=1 Tax=Penaeus chinensis TaxID=139456 RepID=UPI001FB84BF2|nr:uncharacterized protein LOC125036813 [Penaeus chinensis]
MSTTCGAKKKRKIGPSIKLEIVTPAFRLWPNERKGSRCQLISSSTADIGDFGLKSCTKTKPNTQRSNKERSRGRSVPFRSIPSRKGQNIQRLSPIDFRRGRLGGDLRAAPKRRHYANITTCQHRALADTR